MYTKHRSGKLKFRMCAVLKHNNILLHRLCIALIEHTAKKKRISKHISCCTIIQISQLNSVQFQLVSTFLLCLLNAPIELRALSLVFVFSWYICFTQVFSARRRFPNSSMSEMAEKCGVRRHVSPQSHTSLTSSYIFDVRYKATGHVTPFQIDMNEFQRLHTEQTNIQTEQMNIKKNPAK